MFFKMVTLICAGVVGASIADASVSKFKKGDTVAFIGDSITHGGIYHANLYLFYATRFPSQPFKVYNCGISGDTAPGTNERFETDIELHKPNVATIMLGMNDAWAWCFGEGEPTEKMVNGRKNAYDLYTKEMDKLADSLEELDCRIIFIKPSMYDQTAEIEEKNLIGKNDQLSRYAEYLDELAEKYDGTIVDFYSLMMQVNETLQKEDPSATVVGHDRVHPGEQGHFVMSYAFLKAQEMPKWISGIDINAAEGKVVTQKNCSIKAVAKISDNQLSFTCFENALPFPLSSGQKQAAEWVPFQENFNQQLLRVTNLKAGDYELKIDDELVGTYSADDLTKGINLSENPKTPQYKQALEVKDVNDKRLKIVDQLRAIQHVRYTMIEKIEPPVDIDDLDALKAALEAHVEKAEGEPWYYYLRHQADRYIEFAPQKEELTKKSEELMDKIWMVNQPQPRQWSLTPAQP